MTDESSQNPQKAVVDNRSPDTAGRGLPSRKMLAWVGGVVGILAIVITAIDSALPHHKMGAGHHSSKSRHKDLAAEHPSEQKLRRLLRKESQPVPPSPALPGELSSTPASGASYRPASSGAPYSSSATQTSAPAGNPNPFANVDQPPPAASASNQARARWANIRASQIVVQKGGTAQRTSAASGFPAYPGEPAFPTGAPTMPTALPSGGYPGTSGVALPSLTPGGRQTLAGMLQGPKPPSRTHSYQRYLAAHAKASKKHRAAHIEPARRGIAITPGTPIPAILMTRINTQLPGSVVAQITRTVYSPNGRIAIPAGTKAVGSYDSRIFNGQSRTLIAFSRLIFPNGETLHLPGMQGIGVRGSAGVAAHVDNHLWSELGAAFLVAELSNLANLGGSSGSSQTYNYGGGGSSSLGAGGQVIVNQANQILAPYENIPPTLIVEPGKSIAIMVMRTVEFRK